MKHNRKIVRVNVRSLVILVLITGLLGGGAIVAHHVRQRNVATRALANGKAALEQENWAEACKQLKIYLNKYPDDVGRLEDYAHALLSLRPLRPNNVGAAIGAYRRLLRHKPGDAKVCHELAKLYIGIHDYVEAAYVCRQRLNVDANDPTAMMWLGRALAGQQKHSEAMEVLEALVASHPDRVKAYGLLSMVARRRGSLAAEKKAAQWLDQAVDANPRSAAARVQRARYRRMVLKDKDAARNDLEAADDWQTNDPGVQLMFAEEWLSLGDFERARSELDTMGKIDAAALALFDIDPDVFTLTRFMVEGRLLLLRQASEDGVNLADRALEQLPPRHQVAFLPLAVSLYLAGGRIQDARASVEKYRDRVTAQSDVPALSDERLHLLDAAVADAEGKTYAVIRLLEPLVVNRPQTAPAWRLLGNAYEKSGQADRALIAFEQYLVQNPTDREIMLKLARAYRIRNPSKALQYASMAIRTNSEDLEAKLLHIEAGLNLAAEQPSRPERFRVLSGELAALRATNPKVARIRILQANIAAYEGRVDDAILELEAASRECEQKFDAAFELAQYFRNMGRHEKAIETCEQAIQLRPDAALARTLLADLYISIGRQDRARDILVQSVSELTGAERLAVQVALARFIMRHENRENGIERLQHLAEEHPRNAQLRERLLGLDEIQRDSHVAQTFVDELRKIEGESGLRWRVAQANVWLHGDDYRVRVKKIEELLRPCRGADPGWSAPTLALGGLYQKLGRDKEAEEVYRQAITSDSAQVDVADRLLALLERQHRFKDARAVLNRLPDDWPLLSSHRVDTAIGLGDYETAIHELQQRIIADPKDAHSMALLAKLLYAHRKDARAALKLLEKAKGAAPDDLAVVSARVAILQAENRDDEALKRINSEVRRRNDFPAYLLRAEYYASTGRSDLAEKDYSRLIDLPDTAGKGHVMLGKFYHAQGRMDEAIATWNVGLDAFPNNVDLQRLLIKALMTQPDPEHRERGRAMLNSLLNQSPNDTELLRMQADVLLHEETAEATARATSILERVVQLDPHNIKAHLRLFELAREQGNLDEAEDRLTLALGANPTSVFLIMAHAELEANLGNERIALALAGSAIDMDPKSVEARNTSSWIALRAGKIDAALESNNAALALEPGNDVAQVIRARILEIKGQRDEALRSIQSFRETKEGRRSVAALLTLADLHCKRNDFAIAEQDLADAEQLVPNNRDVILLRLRCLAAQHRFDDILSELTNRRDGNNVREFPVLLRGASILASSNVETYVSAARQLFERIIALDPTRIDAHLALAQVAYQQGEHAAAVEAYRRVLALDPYHRLATNGLAWILAVHLHELDEALDIANKELNRFPDDPHLLDTRGVILTMLDKLPEARKDLERCLEVTTDIPTTHARALLHLARICLKRGNMEPCKNGLDNAREIDRQLNVFTEKERAEIKELILSPARHSPSKE